MNIGIIGTGSYIPPVVTRNDHFLEHDFLDPQGNAYDHDNTVIIEKFQQITGIRERRYAPNDMNTSDLGYRAAESAILDAGIDRESIDYIIFAHNFGDVKHGESQGDTLPSLATRVKHLLRIQNPRCIAYDLIFGCPGWVEGLIQAKAFIKSGMAKTCLVIGGETLSRVVDDRDRDSMIFADGAGATILQAGAPHGDILGHLSATYSDREAYFLFFDRSNDPEAKDDTRYIKMEGRRVYEFACIHVPQAMKDCLDQSGIPIEAVKKIFIHQANEKMDEAIVKRLYKLYGLPVPESVMPMMISEMGNNSVATVPTLLDRVARGALDGHALHKGDVVIFASVGAGMNINAVAYRY